ncbi:membrane protein [Wenjunlia tyrosinilytica]|uniref:Membrane protein n=1 Tax=Wenjunlia tyrosinilytica TaxID=1544741 RepID=A0A917ZPU4_9ACTN|nr:membrane protein [Wenjunlia tyrosinilytica]
MGLLRACHPGPSAAVTLLATGLARSAGQDTGGCLRVAACVLAGQLSVGWCNDAVDARRDTAAGRPGKPVASGAVDAATVLAAALAALALTVPLSFLCGLLAGAVHLVAVGAAWGYNLRLKATALSWLPYAVGFGGLAGFVALGLPGNPRPTWWVVVAAALLGVGAHLADVLPDIGMDLANGVRGWPQRLGAARVRRLLPLPLVAASAVLVLAPPGPPGTVGLIALAAAAVTACAGAALSGERPRAPFPAAVAVAAIDVALLLSSGATIV